MTEFSTNQLQNEILSFIRDNFIPENERDTLTHDTPLVTSGRIDSVSILLLIGFLEETYGVSFDVYDIDRNRFNTVASIVEMVRDKRSRRT